MENLRSQPKTVQNRDLWYVCEEETPGQSGIGNDRNFDYLSLTIATETRNE